MVPEAEMNTAEVILSNFEFWSKDQEMQHELFELLGFDRFEFIQELLANRVDIVAGIVQGPSVTKRKSLSTVSHYQEQLLVLLKKWFVGRSDGPRGWDDNA